MGASQSHSVSVLIPTKNGEETIGEVMAMLSLQSIEFAEILIADSGSHDRTIDIVKEYGGDYIHIDPKSFDHGGTRTLLCKKAKGDLLVFLTQDAIPKLRNSVEKLIQPLLNDNSIGCSYGRQLPSFSAEHFASSLRLFNYPESSKVYALADREIVGLKSVFTSNSFSCFRKSALEEIGYFQDGLIFGEDTVAVGRLLLSQYKNAYVADALVYHSHNNTVLQEFKRYFDIGVLHTRERWLLENFGGTSSQGKRYLAHEVEYIHKEKKYSLYPELLLRLAMKYCGYKIGKYYTILPMKVILACSMHNHWWLKKSPSDD